MRQPASENLHDLTLDIWRNIALNVSLEQNIDIEFTDIKHAYGGDINTSLIVQSEQTQYFVKFISIDHAAIHGAEMDALRALKATGTIRVPTPVTRGVSNGYSFLVLEYLPLHRQGNTYLLGQQLANLHKYHTTPNAGNVPEEKPQKFGAASDNFIGLSPQRNSQSRDWKHFWIENRLIPQAMLAVRNGHPPTIESLAITLSKQLPSLFAEYEPAPSLLHGDLWSGNVAFAHETPVLFDPASYFGDRETDIAFTELFGGFDRRFYEGYESIWPLNFGYNSRKKLYNLYHLINHLNLFGEGYLSQCLEIFDELILQTRQ